MMSQAQGQHMQLWTTGIAGGSDDLFFFTSCSSLIGFLCLSLYLSSRLKELRGGMFLPWLPLLQREQCDQYTMAMQSSLP